MSSTERECPIVAALDEMEAAAQAEEQATPVQDPFAPLLLTAWHNDAGDIVINGDGTPLLRMQPKQALALIARIAVAIASQP